VNNLPADVRINGLWFKDARCMTAAEVMERRIGPLLPQIPDRAETLGQASNAPGARTCEALPACTVLATEPGGLLREDTPLLNLLPRGAP
jgi:hypothetical protein